MCGKCAHFDSVEALNNRHLMECQPNLGKWDTGFLAVGALPETGVDMYRDILNMIGIEHPTEKPTATGEEEGTESEQDEDLQEQQDAGCHSSHEQQSQA